MVSGAGFSDDTVIQICDTVCVQTAVTATSVTCITPALTAGYLLVQEKCSNTVYARVDWINV